MHERQSAPDLSTILCGVRLPNPTVLASGILGLSHEVMVRVAQSGAGAITTKSCSLKPRPGYHNPVVLDWGQGLINAVGLSNPGVEVLAEEIRAAKEQLAPLGVPVIASIFAETIYGFGAIARFISEAEPDLIEVNISCPNIDDLYRLMFAADPYVAAQVTRQVKQNTDIPILLKLSPNVTDVTKIARAVVDAGADGITAINTLGPGIILDVETGRPVLAHGTGGLSGPAIRPIAVRCVRDICRAVDAPVIAVGGVTTGRDAVEMVLVGATAVGIGSAVSRRGTEVFQNVCDEIQDYMERHEYDDLEAFRGKALQFSG
ncbi:MAG: dihydroorotate dehydrogenase [Chloroflexi bacterium]|nr:MAG: dihydroorotate dehydrogenase B catalytic subunit [Anaerolineaceae bacterium 4572_32.2]RLC84441.1 MAG: dihydroorotate dehydrogenase [Chloroflexota bacterium]HEY72912.1 dihydroorotate dehydrogenase [Thermoflexia bacterium]